jgi:site-specific DNA recombinase
LTRGSRKITPETIAKFTKLYRAKLDDSDSTLRKAYLRMLVSKVEVSDKGVLITGPKPVLGRGLARGLPRLEASVLIFGPAVVPLT